MIGAAIEFRTLGGYRLYKEGTTRIIQPGEYQDRMVQCGTWNTARPNVSGPPQQAEIHIDCNLDGDTYFAYVSPDRSLNGWNSCVRLHHVDMRHVDALRAILEMMQEKESGDEPAGPAVTCEQFEPPQQSAERQPAHNLPTRGEDTLFLTWWLMMSEDSPIADILRDMTAELQHQDRLDLRQDVAMRTWQRALTAELVGRKARIDGQAVRRLVEQWLTRNGKALRPADAQASPEDAAKARELLEQERDAKRQEEWKREAMRLRAMDSQKAPPAPVLLFTW